MKMFPSFKSDFGIIDVKRGRTALARWRRANPDAKVRLVIYATLGEPNSHDDGTSIEFTIDVKSVEATPEPENKS